MTQKPNQGILSLKYFKKFLIDFELSLILILLCTTQVYATSYSESSFSALGQQKVVTGIVKDVQGNPLPGVNIVDKGTITGTATAIDGKYSITISSPKSVLVYSFIGYITQEITVGSQTSINVTLLESIAGLEEVVVVGYGTQKKVNLTGALSTVSADKLEMRPILSTGQGLQGLIPNFNITFRNGNPAAGGVDFNIRGFESINGGSPLILVDGVPMDIQKINPNDIESITVLKDAAASAIYGARAAFGVVLVTTKSGAKGTEDLSVSYSFETSLSTPIFKADFVDNSYTYALWRNKSAIRSDGTALYVPRFVDAVKAYYEDPVNNPEWAIYDGQLEFYGYNNWKDILVRDYAPTSKHNIVVSGKSDKANYYISFGTLNTDGFYKVGNSNFKRYNILTKAGYDIRKWLSVDEKIVVNYSNNEYTNGFGDDYNYSVVRPVPLVPNKFPNLPGYEDLEGMNIYINSNVLGLNQSLPFFENGGRAKEIDTEIWLTSGITLTPLKDLKIRGEYTKNFEFSESEAVSNTLAYANAILTTSSRIIYEPLQPNSSINNGFYKANYDILNIYGEYSLTKGFHTAKLTAGFNQEYLFVNQIGAFAYGLLSTSLADLDLTNGLQLTSGGRSELALRGAFYRFNYNFKERYLFEANGRYDGSSRFPKSDRFAFFPSFSLGWRISNENFMSSLESVVDNLKIRASYGSLGNQNVGNYYPYIASMGTGLSTFLINSSGQEPMVRTPGLVSSTLTWETVISKNLGLDFTLLKGKIDGSFDIYNRDTKDMLMNAVYPIILGASAPKINGANLRTSGWEFFLTYRAKAFTDFDYSITFSLADNSSKITKYTNLTGTLTDYYEDQKIGQIWGYETVGIFQDSTEITSSADQSYLGSNWRPGDIHYADLDTSGIINPGKNTLADHGDLKVIGNSTPRYTFGLNLNARYKAWSVSLFFQGVGKRDYWPSAGGNGMFWPFNSNTNFENWMIDESWSTSNRDAYFYYPNRYATQNQAIQTRYLQNVAYIRLKNLTVTYTIPETLAGKVGLNKVGIYFSGQNIWEFSKIHTPFDPEQTSTNNMEYPFQRIYSLGLNVGF
jgi:TonB-linked SusC/RagA family outer membrane protein